MAALASARLRWNEGRFVPHEGRIVLRFPTVLALISLAAPAWADVTGRYRTAHGDTVIVEVDENGIARVGGEGMPDYTIFDESDGFIVNSENGVTSVIRLSDLRAIVADRLGEQSVAGPEVTTGANQWVSAGEVTVGGWSGIEYRLPHEPLPEGERIVLSDDTQLAPLGLAWSRALFLWPLTLVGPNASHDVDWLSEMLETRAPLQFLAIKLMSASFDEIEPARFVLPAEPLSRTDIAAMMEARRRRSNSESGD